MSAANRAAPYVFVSYASADRERVLPVVATLERAGVPVWIDREGIHGGANYGREIAKAIKDATAFVLMASPLSLASRNVKQEVAVAWEYERAYLPLLLEPVAIPDDLKYWLTAAQWVEVLDHPEGVWLPAALDALAALGLAPAAPAQAEAAHLPGRERELGMLRERLAEARAGRGRLVLVGGEAGAGKTALAEALLAEAAAQGALVLVGRCYDLAETPPYGPWLEIIAQYPPGAPGLPPVPAVVTDRAALAAVASQAALFEQVIAWFAAVAAARPLVVLLDDLHWADPASLDLLRALARRAPQAHLLLLATYRADELTRRHPLYALLPALVREAHATRLDVRALDDAAVRALVTARYALPATDTARLVAAVQGRAEGNALFLGELLRALEEAGTLRRGDDGWALGDLTGVALPPLLRQVIDARLARLGEEAQRLLALAAVIGQGVPLALWATVAETDEDGLLDTIERAVEARLLTESPDGQGVRFAHALIREALYDGMLALRRRRVHRAVAEALAVAYHFQRTGDPRAVLWLVRAGERAQQAYAWVTAAARFEAALALDKNDDSLGEERGWLQFRLAFLLRYADIPRALAYAHEAVAVAALAGDGILAGYARFAAGLLGCFVGDVARGLPDLVTGADALSTLSDAERERAAARTEIFAVSGAGLDGQGTVVVWQSNVGQFQAARRRGERLLGAQAESTAAVSMGADGYIGLGNAYASLGLPDKAGELYALAVERYASVGHRVMVGQVLWRQARALTLPFRADDIAARRRLVGAIEAAMARASGASIVAPPRVYCASILVVDGAWEEVMRLLLPLLDTTHAWAGIVGFARATVATLARLRGDTALARRAVRDVLSAGAATVPGTTGFFLDLLEAQRAALALALDDGDLVAAQEWLGAHDHSLAWSGAVLGRAEGALAWAAYHRAAGDLATARDHAERALAHAGDPRQPLALLAARRALGELATDAGQHVEAEEHLRASLALAVACEAPYERALTLLAQAGLRAATGDSDAALALLAEARAICEPLGARPALARAEALAARLEGV